MWSKVILFLMFGCSGMLSLTFDMRGLSNGDRMAGIPLGISLGAGELDVEGICTTHGMACQNCSMAVTCVPLPGGWLKLPLEECKDGTTCNAHLGRCSAEPVPECDARALDYQHSCEQVGIFPDAIDCRKFHLCSPPDGLLDGRPAEHRAALCPRHYGYNPLTAQCSIPLIHGQCAERVVPACRNIGEYGVLPTSPNHYYVCFKEWNGALYPRIFICPNGWFFWDGFCRQEPMPEVHSETEPQTGITTESLLQVIPEPEATEKTTTPMMLSFFSTEKSTTYPADTFLADKFDLTNYESTDDVQTNNDELPNHYDWINFDN